MRSEPRSARRVQWGPLLFIKILIMATSGCSSETGEQPSEKVSDASPSGLRFVTRKVDLGAIPSDVSHIDHIFRFTVGANDVLTIKSITASCGCVTVGDSIVGKSLQSAMEYELPARLDLHGRVQFDANIAIATDNGLRTYLFVTGVHETEPRADPGEILCRYGRDNNSTISGTFAINRLRHSISKRLAPKSQNISSEHLRISFVEFEKPAAQSGESSVVRDSLRWKWELVSKPTTNCSEAVEIVWLNPHTPATKLKFKLIESVPVRGLVKRLFCGRIGAGETWRHTLSIYTPPGSDVGAIDAIRCDSDAFTAVVEKRGRFSLVHIELKVPETVGDFEQMFRIHFEGVGPEAVSIVGVVVAPQ